MLANAWTFSPEDALAYYGTSPEGGLTEEQVERNRKAYGENCELSIDGTCHATDVIESLYDRADPVQLFLRLPLPRCSPSSSPNSKTSSSSSFLARPLSPLFSPCLKMQPSQVDPG
jgi:hypothetical protein